MDTTKAVAPLLKATPSTTQTKKRKKKKIGLSIAKEGAEKQKNRLEKHVKTVTMRADSLVTTEADSFHTLIERQEASKRELQILYGQLC